MQVHTGELSPKNEGQLPCSIWQWTGIRKHWHPVAHDGLATTLVCWKEFSFSTAQSLGTRVAPRITICRVATKTTILHSLQERQVTGTQGFSAVRTFLMPHTKTGTRYCQKRSELFRPGNTQHCTCTEPAEGTKTML